MPAILFSLNDLQHLIGKKLSIEEVKELAHYAKADVEHYDEEADEVKIEFGDTNLPYLWSVEGFARFLRGYLGIMKGIPKIKIEKGPYKVVVDKNVMEHRPYIACFAAKGSKINDYLLKQLVQLQEKFCEGYGRRRQKVSIGLYSYDKIIFPVHYKCVSPKTEFIPLEFKSNMSLKNILEEHPKGKEYAYVLNKFEEYPILIDDKNEILSFVPIINSNFTGKLEIGDENIFFEATGTDKESVNLAANIFAYALSERGFHIYSSEIKYPDSKSVSPSMECDEIKIKNDEIKNIFGIEIKEKEVKHLLEKASYEFDNWNVKIPPYRKDILHPRDVIEDIGIMYGFDNVPDKSLETFTVGKSLEINNFIAKIREILAGTGYQETLSPILTNKELLYKKMNIEDFGTIEIEEYMSETYSAVRSWVLPNVVEVLSKNKHVEYPQNIFEEGIVTGKKNDLINEHYSCAAAVSHEGANYTNVRQTLDYIGKLIGIEFDYAEESHSSFIEGRCAVAKARGRKIAVLGEVNPKVLENWNLEMPVAAMEINLTELFDVVNSKHILK